MKTPFDFQSYCARSRGNGLEETKRSVFNTRRERSLPICDSSTRRKYFFVGILLPALLWTTGCSVLERASSQSYAFLTGEFPSHSRTQDFFGPSSTPRAIGVSDTSTWLEDGSVAIGRPAPIPQKRAVNNEFDTAPQLLSFAPLPSDLMTQASPQPRNTTPQGTWLAVNRTEGTLTVMNNESPLYAIATEGNSSLTQGRHTVVQKVVAPSWYAPNAYFEMRDISVPPEGASERYLRGVFGSVAIFLSPTFALHCGPVWTEEVGGLRLPCVHLQSLFQLLTSGAVVQVK